jgi:hypothetical protein
MKDFTEEIYKIFDKFKKGNPFCFSKYADGEWAIISNDYLNNREFEFSKNTPIFYKQKLIESIKYKDINYYIGTCCPCCNGDRAQKMREFSDQNEENMTFANIFVNANYPIYKETFLKSYRNYDVHLVANERSKIENLPFKIEKFYPVSFSAWVNNYSLIEQIKQQNLTNKLFLFCAGPFGNLLAHQLYEINKKNIYLDIGSTLNPWLQSEGFKRDYYMKGYFSERKCIWNKI